MDAVAAGLPKQGSQVKANEVIVIGRINYVSSFDASGKRVHEARVAIPAADAYSMPGAVLVQASTRIGAVGDDVKLHCQVTGFPDKWTDKASGEVKQTARVVLRVIE